MFNGSVYSLRNQRKQNHVLSHPVALEHNNFKHKDKVVINWCIGNLCNYSCTYCPEDLHNGSKEWPSLQQVKDFCTKAVKHYEGKTLYFEFTGGEVTLWKELPEVLSYLKSIGCDTGIISNGSRAMPIWEKLVPLLDHVCLSFHPESGKAEHFLKVVKYCADKIRTHVNFMMHLDHFTECLSLAYKVKDIPSISIAIQPLVIDFGEKLYPYTDHQRKIMNQQNVFLASFIKHEKKFEYYRGAMNIKYSNGKSKTMAPQRFISSQQNQWTGWECYAGLEQIVIDMHGGVYRGWCLEGGTCGNVLDGTVKFPDAPVTCTKSFCHCNLDIMTTKVRPPNLPITSIEAKSNESE